MKKAFNTLLAQHTQHYTLKTRVGQTSKWGGNNER